MSQDLELTRSPFTPHQSDSDFKVANSFGGKSHIVYEYGVNIKVEPPAL